MSEDDYDGYIRSLLQEKYGSHAVLFHKNGAPPELPDSLRLAASLRTCGDPDCYFPQHLTAQARDIFALLNVALTEWLADGSPAP